MASTLTKIECYGYVPLLGGLVGAGGGGLIQSFVEAVLKYFNLPPTGVNSPWFWMAGGVIVGCFIFWKMLVNVIRESQKRMSDANYVARLKELRLL